MDAAAQLLRTGLNPSGAGSQSLRISLPKRFWPLIGAHVVLLNGSQIVRNRRCRVCSEVRAGDSARDRRVVSAVFAGALPLFLRKKHAKNCLYRLTGAVAI